MGCFAKVAAKPEIDPLMDVIWLSLNRKPEPPEPLEPLAGIAGNLSVRRPDSLASFPDGTVKSGCAQSRALKIYRERRDSPPIRT